MPQGGDGLWLERLERYFEIVEPDYETSGFRRGCFLRTPGHEIASANDGPRAWHAAPFYFGDWLRR